MRLLSEYRHDVKSDTSLIDRLTAELGRAHADIIALRKGNEEETMLELRKQLKDALAQIASVKESGVVSSTKRVLTEIRAHFNRIQSLANSGRSDETEVVHMVDNPLNAAATEHAQSLDALTKVGLSMHSE